MTAQQKAYAASIPQQFLAQWLVAPERTMGAAKHLAWWTRFHMADTRGKGRLLR